MDPDLLRRVFPGGSEVASRLKELDWTSNDLGTPDSWSHSLQTSVAICLASRIPMQVWWGANRALIYNDACVPLMGERHPGALAHSGIGSVTPDVWNAIGPAIQAAFETG